VSNKVQWRTHAIAVVLIGGMIFALMRHGPTSRDSYRSLEDCRRDWGNIPNAASHCSSVSVSSGGLAYYGPIYPQGKRPATQDSNLRLGIVPVSRGGFGDSGAHVGASGG
jgi:hypothetical protein